MVQEDLAGRVRAGLAAGPPVREVAMFGGRSFMVNGKMVAAARKTGDLLVRVSPDRHAELLGRPEAAQAEMGAGRSMGEGWISVSGDAVADQEQLAFWLGVALEFNRSG